MTWESVLLSSFLTLQAGDMTTTCIALHSGRFVEGNTLMPSTCPRIVLVKAGATAGLVALGTRVRTRKGKIVYYAVLTGISVYPVVSNLRALQR